MFLPLAMPSIKAQYLFHLCYSAVTGRKAKREQGERWERAESQRRWVADRATEKEMVRLEPLGHYLVGQPF
jgi:hypothetical protein